MNRKQEILKDNFIYFKNADITDFDSLSYEHNKFFFDTENAPIFSKDIIEKYNLTQVEYDTLEDFQDVSKNSLLNSLIRDKKITTEIYVWQFGCNLNDKVYWGNTIDEFIEFITKIDEYRINQDLEVVPFQIYVHNLAWDIEFFKYWFKENEFKQIVSVQSRAGKRKNSKLQNHFDITETEGTVHNARIQLEKKAYKKGKKKVEYLTTLAFFDSMKITPMSLKSISEDLIKVDDIYIKNSEVYEYNTVRDPKTYIPNQIESWYIYCDIYLLKEWYNQFIIPNYINNGIDPFTISQIAFDSILHASYNDDEIKQKYYNPQYDKDMPTDRQIYERHFALPYIEKNELFKEYFRLSYKGGHTTASSKYRELAKGNNEIISGVSMDITSSYPHQMTNKPMPFGFPRYAKGKYKTYTDRCNKTYDFHFITIAFDGFVSKNPNNQFGLNMKLYGLNNNQMDSLGLNSVNESATTNYIEGDGFVGYNRIEVKDHNRKLLLQNFNHSFIVTLTHHEFEEWERNFDFIYFDRKGINNGVRFIDYVSCQSEIGHFAKGLDYFFKQKEEGDLEGNKAKTLNSKLIINSFYGKHCSRREREQRFYDFTKDIISFQPVTEENENCWEDNSLYAIQYGSAVTAWGRIQLRETCRKVGQDKFIYADTDSLKFNIDFETFKKICKDQNIDISYCKAEKQLGFWDFEFSFNDFKAVGQKKYMYQLKEGDKFKCKCAGLPKSVRELITTKEQFSLGKEFIKKAKKKVIGGNLLIDTKYKISDVILL